MNLVNYDKVIEEINRQFSLHKTNYALLVDCENYSDFNMIIGKYQADSTVKIFNLSSYSKGDTVPKIPEMLLTLPEEQGNILFVGVSQFLHFLDDEKARTFLSQIYEKEFQGNIVFLLEHYQLLLQKLTADDIRRKDRTVLLDGEYEELPQIIVFKNKDYCKSNIDFTTLLKTLEQFKYNENLSCPGIYSSFSTYKDYFKNSSYQMTFIENNFDMLKNLYPNEIIKFKQTDGNEEQWGQLLSDLEKHNNITKVFQSYPMKDSLSENIAEAIKTKKSIQCWYFWLRMKYFGQESNTYFSNCLLKTNNCEELERAIYFTILDYNHTDPLFIKFYQERKNIIKYCPDNIELLDEYLDVICKFQKNSLYYLTDKTYKEQQAIMQALAYYSYSNEELLEIVNLISTDLLNYLEHFEFKQSNLKLPESDISLYTQFNEYFDKYKYNKIFNKVPGDFIELVNKNAETRPYNKLQTRISIINKLLQQKNIKVFFIDALGVEYLSYIQQKCYQYNMIADIQVAKSELPSVTIKNKEFIDNSNHDIVEIRELDEMKHKDLYTEDNEKCKEPIHIFNELQIINDILTQIQIDLNDKKYEHALIVSDHGASRLAVIYQENSIIELDDKKGKNSGRCCQIEEDPHLPNCAYENGHVILANYDRFKGSRKASVEVHGGASLEEVLVPIINISLKPKYELYFESPVVLIKPKEIPEIILISSKLLTKPILEVNNIKYEGEHINRNHYKFKMPDMKRTRSYEAIIFDGDSEIGKLEFSTKASLAKHNDDMLL